MQTPEDKIKVFVDGQCIEIPRPANNLQVHFSSQIIRFRIINAVLKERPSTEESVYFSIILVSYMAYIITDLMLAYSLYDVPTDAVSRIKGLGSIFALCAMVKVVHFVTTSVSMREFYRLTRGQKTEMRAVFGVEVLCLLALVALQVGMGVGGPIWLFGIKQRG